jgi:hypothetical protein
MQDATEEGALRDPIRQQYLEPSLECVGRGALNRFQVLWAHAAASIGFGAPGLIVIDS